MQNRLQKGKAEQKPQVLVDQHKNPITFICELCKELISHSAILNCEHTFCEICIREYLLFIDECPSCLRKARHQKIYNNIILDNLIFEFVKKQDDPSVLHHFENRLEEFKEYQRKSRSTDFNSGMKVDVRDPQYVWTAGKICRTINRMAEKKTKYLVIKYDKSTKKEEIPESSDRIAPIGFYTSRIDIPYYRGGKLTLDDRQEDVRYLLPAEGEDDELSE